MALVVGGVMALGTALVVRAAGPTRLPAGSAAADRTPTTPTPQPGLPSSTLVSPVLPAQIKPSLDCLIEPNQTVELATSVSGIVKVVNVDRGDLIHTGQVLAQLEAEVEKANVAHERARTEFTSKKYHRMEELLKEQMVSTQQMEEAKADYELAAAELRKATEMLNQRTVFSPFNGVVVDRYVSPGELIESKKVLKVAQINPLNVEVIAPISMLGEFKPGGAMRVVPEGAAAGPFLASVRLVDRVVDAASGTFRVRLTLANPRNQISAGVRCKASLVKAAPPKLKEAPPKIAAPKTPGTPKPVTPRSGTGKVATPEATASKPEGTNASGNPSETPTAEAVSPVVAPGVAPPQAAGDKSASPKPDAQGADAPKDAAVRPEASAGETVKPASESANKASTSATTSATTDSAKPETATTDNVTDNSTSIKAPAETAGSASPAKLDGTSAENRKAEAADAAPSNGGGPGTATPGSETLRSEAPAANLPANSDQPSLPQETTLPVNGPGAEPAASGR